MRTTEDRQASTPEVGAIPREGYVASNNSAFWRQFGLSNSPYEDNTDPTRAFETRKTPSYISEIQDFLQGHASILAIPSIVGSGKTCLIRQFLALPLDPYHVTYFNAQTSYNVLQLLDQLTPIKQFFSRENISYTQLCDRVTEFVEENGPQLLVIDDAHRLSKETMVSLVKMISKLQQDDISLRIIMCGEPQVEDQIKYVISQSELELEFPVITIEPMTTSETKAYLEHCLYLAGYEGDSPFTIPMVKRIHSLSGGYPGRINRVAQQVLMEAIKDQNSDSTLGAMKQILQEHKIKILCGSVLLLAAMIYFKSGTSSPTDTPEQTPLAMQQDPIPNQPVSGNIPEEGQASDNSMMAMNDQGEIEEHTVSQTEQEKNAAQLQASQQSELSPQQSHTTPSASKDFDEFSTQSDQAKGAVFQENDEDQPMNVPHEKLDKIKLAPGNTVQTKPAKSKPLAKAKTEPKKVATSSASKIKVSAKSDHASKVLSAKPVVPATASVKKSPVAGPSVAAVPKTAISPKKPESALLTKNGFTVQLMGLSEQEELKHFAERSGLLKNGTILQTELHNKPWYVLVLGHYHSSEEAHSALQKLSPDLQSLHPWVRSLSSIHEASKSS